METQKTALHTPDTNAPESSDRRRFLRNAAVVVGAAVVSACATIPQTASQERVAEVSGQQKKLQKLMDDLMPMMRMARQNQNISEIGVWYHQVLLPAWEQLIQIRNLLQDMEVVAANPENLEQLIGMWKQYSQMMNSVEALLLEALKEGKKMKESHPAMEWEI